MKKLTGDISYKELLVMWLPLALSGVFAEVYGVVNKIVVSHFINSEAVAVMASVGPYQDLKSYIFNGMTLGFGLVVCRAFSKKRLDYYESTLRISLLLTFVLCAIALIAIPFTGVLTKICNVPESLVEDAKSYLVFLLLDCIALAIKNILSTIINGMGEMKIIGFTSVLGVVMQSVLVYVLIGVKHQKVWGASCSVFLTDLLIGCILLIVFLYRNKQFKKDFAKTATDDFQWKTKDQVIDLLYSGASKPVMMGFVAIGAFFTQYAVNNFSSDIIAGLSYADTITNLFMAPICAVASLGAAVGAQNVSQWSNKKQAVGEEQKDNGFRITRKRMNMISFVLSVFAIICVTIFAPRMIAFLGEAGMSSEIIRAGATKLRIAIWGFPLLALYLIDRAVFHSMGKNIYMPLLGFTEMVFAIIGGLFFIPRYECLAVGIFILIKWIVPGILSEAIARRHM